MARRILSFRLTTAAAAMVVFAGCMRDEAPSPSARPAPKANPASARDWTSEQIKNDPVGCAMAAIREKEIEAGRLRDQETKLEIARQKAERELAAITKAEAEARSFGREAVVVCRNPSTVYPVTVAGRSFRTRESLYSEIKEADRTCSVFVTNKVILANQSARTAALLSKLRDRLSANASERYELERKADAARTAIAERDFDAIVAIANDLSDSIEAALPSDELFAPPVRNLGEPSIDEKLDQFNF